MCSHFESVTKKDVIKQHFDAEVTSEDAKTDIWPGYRGLLIRPARPGREAISGSFGLIPHWASDNKIARHTYNARTETVASKPSFREAWKKGQHCIIPAAAIYEPDWRSGKAIPTRIYRSDGHPMGIAGLWDCWQPDKGDPVISFTMLTVNADGHPLMQQFHKPADEKRMVVILPEEQYRDWLEAGQSESMDFMRLYPADNLAALAQQEAKQATVKPKTKAAPDLFGQ
jgi:putative SOS response-associated peptidase YedK